MTGVVRYAGAGQVWLGLTEWNATVELTIRDDGAGFDTARSLKSAYGLVGMRFRVEAEGGRMAVESAPGQGCLVRVSLPAAAEPAATA